MLLAKSVVIPRSQFCIFSGTVHPFLSCGIGLVFLNCPVSLVMTIENGFSTSHYMTEVMFWVIWCARNEVVFNDIQWTIWKILSKIRSLHDTIVCAFGTSTLSRPARMVKWHPPAEHWVKLNVDGSSLGNPIISGFGGLLRNMHIGEWIVGFFGNCGLTTNLTAELSAIAMGILNLLGHLVLKISFASLTRRLLWS